MEEKVPLYHQIYAVVRQIPRGRVASYGQVARILGNCTPRMVGYAMSATPSGSDIPWHRVINAQGKISIREGISAFMQRQLLEEEGVVFNESHQTDFSLFGWQGPGE